MWTSGERRASGCSAAGTTCSSKCGAHASRKAAIDSGECASDAATRTSVTPGVASRRSAFRSGATTGGRYSTSPATYEQTNARARHILVATEEEAQDIKSKIEAGTLDFSDAAVQFSSCSSASRGGKLGKFNPGQMAPEFDDVVFGLDDTGMINLKNDAALFEPGPWRPPGCTDAIEAVPVAERGSLSTAAGLLVQAR